ncbi:MAG: hypothetical protein V4641_16180 [Pseudomonadota bacterium]
MTIYQGRDAKLFIRDGKEWTELELSKAQSYAAEEVAREVEQRLAMMKAATQASDEYQKGAELRGNQPAMVIMDEVFGHDHIKHRVVDRALDHLFVYGTGSSTPLVATMPATPAMPPAAGPMPTYCQINDLLSRLLARAGVCP